MSATLGRKQSFGYWFRFVPRVKRCDGCHLVAVCWWLSATWARTSAAHRDIQWRCIACLPKTPRSA